MYIGKRWVWGVSFALILGTLGCATLGNAAGGAVIGDSLVLAGTEPGALYFANVVPGSVVVRNAYDASREGAVTFEENYDYVVDYEAGTIARTEGSRIPDFKSNVLYGQKNFDHSKFPGFGNTPHFVFVDYRSRDWQPLVEPKDQSALLPRTKEKLEAGESIKLIAYGDSITAGGDATAVSLRFQQRYADYLRAKFGRAEIVVENGATGGDSTVNGLARLEEKVLTRDPDLVIIGFGMNDHNKNGVPPEKFEENLVTIGTRIREATGAELILFSTFPPNDDWMHSSHRMDAYAAATERAAARLGCAYVDVYGVWMRVLERKDPPSLLGNNINHPNDFGHWIYSEVLANTTL